MNLLVNIADRNLVYVRNTGTPYTHAALHYGTRFGTPCLGITMHTSAASASKAKCVWMKATRVEVVPVTEAPKGVKTSKELSENRITPTCFWLWRNE